MPRKVYAAIVIFCFTAVIPAAGKFYVDYKHETAISRLQVLRQKSEDIEKTLDRIYEKVVVIDEDIKAILGK